MNRSAVILSIVLALAVGPLYADAPAPPPSTPAALSAVVPGGNLASSAADKPFEGATPLMQASATGQIDTMQALLDKDADVKLADLLMTNHADVHAESEQGQTALILASYKGNSEMVRFLLAHDADIRDTDVNGTTPLMAAIAGGNVDTVKLLIAKGAGLNDRNTDDMTPLEIADGMQKTDIADMLRKAGAE